MLVARLFRKAGCMILHTKFAFANAFQAIIGNENRLHADRNLLGVDRELYWCKSELSVANFATT